MKIIQTIKNLNLIRKNGVFLQIVADIFKFVDKTHKDGVPMLCQIAMIQKDNLFNHGSFVSLWAGIGDANPIERCRHLKAQNIELIRLLNIAKKGNISAEDKQLIDITIKCFDK